MGIAFYFFAISYREQPFRSRGLNRIKIFSELQLFCILLVCAVMQANEAEPDFEGDPIDMNDYGNLLTALTLAVLPCVIYVMTDNACGCENDFLISDHAKWNKHDKNIPKNSVGEVMGYGEKKNEAGYDVEDESIIQLQFVKGGQWWPFPVEELTKVKGKKVKKRLGGKRNQEVYQDAPVAKEPKKEEAVTAGNTMAFSNPLVDEEEEVANPVHEPGEIEFPNPAAPLTRYDTVVVQNDDGDVDDGEKKKKKKKKKSK